ncbi:MAG: hypothetical protein ACRC7N_09125 [Clostridium sp.]
MKGLKYIVLFTIETFVLLYEFYILENAYSSFFLTVLLMVIVQYINTTIHELGHLFSGLLVGGEFISFSVGPIKIRTVKNKIKIDFSSNDHSGSCAVFPKNDSKKTHIFITSGGFVFNIITVISTFLILKYFDLGIYEAFMLVILIRATYMVITNAVPYLLGDNTDGTVLYKILFKDNFAKEWAEFLKVTQKIKEGIRPCDIEESLDYENVEDRRIKLALVLYSHLRALDKGYFKEVENHIKFLEENMDKLPLNKDVFLSELIYYYSVIDRDLEKAENYFSLCRNRLEKDMDINGRRSMAVYYYYVKGEKEKAKECCEDGLRVLSQFQFKGQALLEKDIIEKILEEVAL